MSNSVKTILAIVVLVLIGGGLFLAASSKTNNSNSGNKAPSTHSTTTDATKTQTQKSTTTPNAAAAADTITYDGSSFSPSSLTVKVGDAIEITNQSSASLAFNSDQHPTHTDEPELNVGTIDAGQTKTFNVTKAGSWGYHNHLNPSQKGMIVAQ